MRDEKLLEQIDEIITIQSLGRAEQIYDLCREHFGQDCISAAELAALKSEEEGEPWYLPVLDEVAAGIRDTGNLFKDGTLARQHWPEAEFIILLRLPKKVC